MHVVAHTGMNKETSRRFKAPIFITATIVAALATTSFALSGGGDSEKVASPKNSEPSVAEAYLNEVERPEPETSPQLPEGYQVATLSPESTPQSLSLVKPEEWLPLEPQYFGDASSDVSVARYGNGNGEFIEVAYGIFNEKDAATLIMEQPNSSSTVSSKLSTKTPDKESALTPGSYTNELFVKVRAKGEKNFSERVTPEVKVKGVSDPLSRSAEEEPFDFSAPTPLRSQYKVGEGHLFDFVQLLNEDKASYSVVIHRAGDSDITDEGIESIVRSLKTITKA